MDKNRNLNLDWGKAYSHFLEVQTEYRTLINTPGENRQLALQTVFHPLAERYESGERTEALYNAMLNVK
jgi:hypothetical protein